MKNLESWLGLESLEKGTDSIQIRVFQGCALDSDWLLLVLNHTGKKWIAEVSWVKDRSNLEKEEVDSMSRKVSVDSPISGWKNFINNLFDLRILSIEDERIIPKEEYITPTDGCGMAVEVATKNVYRTYAYNNPKIQSKKYWQVVNINAIIKLLYKEFRVLNKWNEEIKKKLTLSYGT